MKLQSRLMKHEINRVIEPEGKVKHQKSITCSFDGMYSYLNKHMRQAPEKLLPNDWTFPFSYPRNPRIISRRSKDKIEMLLQTKITYLSHARSFTWTHLRCCSGRPKRDAKRRVVDLANCVMRREYIVVEKLGNSITSAGRVVANKGEVKYRTVTLVIHQDQARKGASSIGDESEKIVRAI